MLIYFSLVFILTDELVVRGYVQTRAYHLGSPVVGRRSKDSIIKLFLRLRLQLYSFILFHI